MADYGYFSEQTTADIESADQYELRIWA
ncbi:uncharacterized protein METZ01_LOCUS15308 [marine metagenome]|uniref:Uncharacterized protein n=1 Tax=marine metagenome TaxID=408172 RepID=A0A381P785_9ZZZZ